MRFVIAFLMLLLSASATGQAVASVEKISLDVPAASYKRGSQIAGELRIPDSKRERLPAVVIINSSPGFDGRGAFYAEALNAAGIATLELDIFQGSGLPASPVQNLPHAFASLQYLAAHPRIDDARVGVMGFSWGGQIVLVASSARLRDEYGTGSKGFAAHLALYPQCWVIRTARSGKDPLLTPRLFDSVAGGPVHILAGDRDGYDGPDGCKLFVDWLPATTRANYSVTIYEGATFAWDHKFGGATYEAGGRRGQGGIVEVVADPKLAATSRDLAVRYFLQHLDSR
jgi:dienelactone hydrolase